MEPNPRDTKRAYPPTSDSMEVHRPLQKDYLPLGKDLLHFHVSWWEGNPNDEAPRKRGASPKCRRSGWINPK